MDALLLVSGGGGWPRGHGWNEMRWDEDEVVLPEAQEEAVNGGNEGYE